MIVTFTPVEGDTRRYEFRLQKLASVEAAVIEKLTGMDYRTEFLQRLQGSALAQRALVYVFEKRSHPTLGWASFDFPVDAVEFEPDAADLADSRAALTSGKVDLTPDEIEAALRQVDALEAEMGEQAPKSPTTGTSDEPSAT